ncbi:uncharacterized protein LOC142329537 [Lycorma delicatula]|uniref:uncharacterized protein LOC142329537 n=1 Tax=Lycorma delicatula TaxID=130591 RepID=UPI003F5146EC
MEKISTDGQFPEKKWNLQVKLKQLRNVTELQEKSAVQSQFTATSTFKRQAERIKKLSEENKKLKQTLDSNIKGVDLQRRKAMQRNHPYQLAYHHKPTEKIIENISSIIFDKTKKLDKLRYEKQKIENNLTSLKGQLYSNYADKSDLNTWSAQEILNKLQNISVKLNAAITVKKTYEQLIQILKKDAQNYDKTLASLKYDRVIQSKCILSATEMGQKVSEDLSLLESECRNEEINIYTIMKEMDVTAKSMKSELDQNIASCNTAIRNESVTRLDSDEEKEVIAEDLNEFSSHSSLNRDPNDVEDIFKEIMTVTGITNIEDIYQRIDQQIEQNVKLLKQIHLKNTLRDKLLDQRNQLEGLLENLETSSLAAINSVYCSDILLKKVKPAMREKRRGSQRKGVILLHDNARPNTAQLTQETNGKMGWEICSLRFSFVWSTQRGITRKKVQQQ